MNSSFRRRKFINASGYSLNYLLDCGKQISVEEWCDVSEKKLFGRLSNYLESRILFCFPSGLFSYVEHLNMFLRFSLFFSHLFWGYDYLLVTSLLFSPSITVLLLWEIVKLLNTSDFNAAPVLPAKVVALRSLPPDLGEVLGSVLCNETIGISHVCESC